MNYSFRGSEELAIVMRLEMQTQIHNLTKINQI